MFRMTLNKQNQLLFESDLDGVISPWMGTDLGVPTPSSTRWMKEATTVKDGSLE